MSKTALDLSRALEKLHLMIDLADRTVCSDKKRMERFRRGAVRVARRLRSIPANAPKQIAEMRKESSAAWRSAQDARNSNEAIHRELDRLGALRRQVNGFGLSPIGRLRKVSVGECGESLKNSILQERNDARKEIAEMKQDEAQNMRWLKEAHEQRNWAGVGAVLYCSRTPELTQDDLDWAMGVVKGGDTMTEGERRVRAMSTELLSKNLPAVGQARSQWHAMSKGLLEKKPDCPLCKMLHSTTNCEGKCALYVHAHEPSEDMPVNEHKCGPEYVRWVLMSEENNNDLRDPAILPAAGKMAELLDRLHRVIAGELRARAEDAMDLGPEVWCGFEVGAPVQHDVGWRGLVVGGNETLVQVKYDNGKVCWSDPVHLTRVPPPAKPESWHGFKIGDRVRDKKAKGVVVDGHKTAICVEYDGSNTQYWLESSILAHVSSWHGFEEGERVRHKTALRNGVVKNGNREEVLVAFDGDSCTLGAFPTNLTRIPVEPGNLCSTCARHDDNDSRYDDSCFPGHFPAPHCDTWVPRVPAEAPEPKRWHGFSEGQEVPYESRGVGVVIGGDPENVTLRRKDGSVFSCPPPHLLLHLDAPAEPDRLCSTCTDHGKCDGDSTPEDGCWQVEPWPGWDAQASEENETCPLCRDGMNKHLADVKAIHAEFKDGAIYVRSSRAPDTDLAAWSAGRFAVNASIRMQSLADLINELAQRAGLSGKAGG